MSQSDFLSWDVRRASSVKVLTDQLLVEAFEMQFVGRCSEPVAGALLRLYIHVLSWAYIQ